MTKKKKTFLLEIVIRSQSPKVPDFGLGKGVLGRQEITFTDAMSRGWKSPLFGVALNDAEDKLIHELVGARWKELRGKRKGKRS